MNGWMKAALLSIRHFNLPFVVRHLLLGVTRFCQQFFWLVQQFGAVAIKQIASELHFKYFGTVFSLLPSLSRSLLPLTLPYLMLANTLGVQSLSTVRSLQSASTSSNSHLEQSVHCSTFTFEPQRQSERVREGEQEINGYFAAWWSNDLQSEQSANRKFIIFTVDFTAFSGDAAGAGAELNFHLSVSPCTPPIPSPSSLTSLSLYGDNWHVRAILFLSLLPYRFVLRCVGPECLVYTIYSATIYPVLCKCSHRENCFLCSALLQLSQSLSLLCFGSGSAQFWLFNRSISVQAVGNLFEPYRVHTYIYASAEGPATCHMQPAGGEGGVRN